MNEFLAEIYNTRESIGASQDNSDVEKLAEAQLLDEALRAEGVDIDKLPGETILKLAHQLLGDDSALVKAAAEESAEHEEGEKEEKEETEEKKEASEETFEEKVAQADFLGRVMAHSFWNEKGDIEKTGGMPPGLKKGLERAGKFVSKKMTGAKKAVGKAGEAVKEYHREGAKDIKSAITGKLEGLPGKMGKKERFQAAFSGAKKFAPHAAAAGLAGAGIHHATKSASAIDVLAEKRAMEWAEAHGLVNDEPTEEMKLAAAVDQRAAEMLAEAGIDVNAVEASAQE